MTESAQFRSRAALIIILVMLASSCDPGWAESGEPIQPAPEVLLNPDFLLGSSSLATPRATTAFAPAGEPSLASHEFNGLLTLDTGSAINRIEVLVDTFGAAREKHSQLTTLPPFSFQYVSDGSALIPVNREPQRSSHPYWEIILEPGQVWTRSNDLGWSRASLPFALKEKNQNCIHNGLMTFLFKQDGSISRVAWQITSETCLYLKVNLWGIIEASYEPGPVPASGKIITAYRAEVANRLPVKPFSALAIDYPGLDLTAFEPGGLEDASVYGFVVAGVHYRSECLTRYGPYPYCDVFDLPSYSLSKSIFASLTYLILSKRWPEFASTSIAELVPECRLPDKRWDEVFAVHLLNMSTGNYDSRQFDADEDAGSDAFFLAETHKDKLRLSCETWPHKSSAGTHWVYHTTDTYLLGVAMNTFLKQKLGAGADIHRDLLYPQILEPLHPSPVMRWSQRTYDGIAQPFTGYGLVLHNDDLARIALALSPGNTIGTTLAGTDFDSAMFRSGSPWQTPPGKKGLAYSHGFWGIDISEWLACSSAIRVPFMSGYGGIAVALLPNNSVYYFFTDSNQHTFRNAVVEANKALHFCDD